MELPNRIIIALLVSVGVVSSGCTSTQQTSVSVRSVAASSHCGFSDETLKIITSEKDIPKRLQTNLHATQFDHLGSTAKNNDAIESAVAEHNNPNEKLILASMGQRANSGYQIQLTSGQATLERGVLTLPLEVTEPDPDAFYAQVMVTPCVLVAVETDLEIIELRY